MAFPAKFVRLSPRRGRSKFARNYGYGRLVAGTPFDRQHRRLATISLFTLVLAASARAHELSIDQLRLWVAPDGGQLRGQLTFDPELTRSLEAELPDEFARTRIADFVTQQLFLQVNGRRCAPELSVRELYERGGASAGDVVMLSCPLSHEEEFSVSVGIGSAIPALLVVGVGMTVAPSAASPSLEATTVRPADESAAATVAAGGSIVFGRRSAALTSGPAAPRQYPGRLLHLAGAFAQRGFEHVLPSGLDHLLFVGAITMSAYRSIARLSLLLGLFTLAHTAAVAWAALGQWTPPPTYVEPCIAASIAVAGFAAYRQRAWLHTAPLVFVFGLVHGLGFAGGLAALESDFATFIVAVIAFNVGVEVAQLLAVLAVLGVVYALRRLSPRTEAARLTSRCGLAIAAVGAVWTLIRLTS